MRTLAIVGFYTLAIIGAGGFLFALEIAFPGLAEKARKASAEWLDR